MLSKYIGSLKKTFDDRPNWTRIVLLNKQLKIIGVDK